MSISQLYQQTIKLHNDNPVGYAPDFVATIEEEGYNPSCGDELTLSLCIDAQGEISPIGFTADACAICKASASLMCEHSLNKHAQQLLIDIEVLSEAIRLGHDIPFENLYCLGQVSRHRSRINCALLPWQTLAQAIRKSLRSEMEKSNA